MFYATPILASRPSLRTILRALVPFLALCALALASGCASSGGYGRSPWGSSASAPAQGDPSPLTSASAPAKATSGTPATNPGDYASVFGDTLYGTAPKPSSPGSTNANPSSQTAMAATSGSGQSYAVPPAVAAPPAFAPVKVGLLLPSSGKNAQTGQAMLKAAQLAVFDLGYPGFELVPRDTGDSPEGAARAAREALSAGAKILIGPLTAASARAVQPIARATNVNMLTFSTDWTLAGQNTYVMGFLPFSQVRRIAAFAAQKGLKSVAVIAPENEYGAAIISSFSEQAPAFGLRVAEIVRVPANGAALADKVRALATKSASVSLDSVLIAAGGDQARVISDTLTQEGLSPDRITRLGTGLWDDSMTAANGALEGAWFAAPSPHSRASFERKYASLYGVNPPRLATLAYDATALAAVLARTAPQQQGQDSNPFTRAALLNPNGFAGLDGIFRFRNDGLVERGDAILTFRGRTIVESAPAPDSFQAQGF